MRSVYLLLIGLLLSGCANEPNLDFNSRTDFNRINQYLLLEPTQGQDPLMNKRINDALVAELGARGWTRINEGDAQVGGNQVAVAYLSWVETRSNDSGLSIGLGGGRTSGNTSVGGSVHIPVGSSGREVMVIRIDMVQEGELIWRASDDFRVRSGDSPEKRNALTRETVTKLLAQFPPR